MGNDHLIDTIIQEYQEEQTMQVIGLTGGIAAGKSVVSEMLAKLGAHIINADKIGHEIYLPQKEAWRDIVATFGSDILLPDQRVDRAKLGSIVFGNKKALGKLNQITHPRIVEEAQKEIEKLRAQGENGKPIIFEAAILIEANWLFLVDKVWVVVADKEVVIERLQQDRNLTRAQSESRIDSQLSNEERIRYADLVIENNGSEEELQTKLEAGWRLLY